MGWLRNMLRVPAINHTAKAMTSVLPSASRSRIRRKLPLVDPFTIPLPNGNHIAFEPFGDICSKFLKFDGWNGYEQPSIELFYALAQHAQVTFDVGAYLGYFGLLAAAARPGAKAYIFEAVPSLARMAERLALRNPHLQATVVSAAVANHSGSITLYLPDDPLNSDTSTNPAHRQDRKPVVVTAVSLDDFMESHKIDRVDLLKIDTETTEPAVLAGFAKGIARARPTFICEVLPSADVPALQRFCDQHAYDTAWIRPAGLVPMPRIVPDAALTDMNYLFFPRGGTGPMADEVRCRLTPPS